MRIVMHKARLFFLWGFYYKIYKFYKSYNFYKSYKSYIFYKSYKPYIITSPPRCRLSQEAPQSCGTSWRLLPPQSVLPQPHCR